MRKNPPPTTILINLAIIPTKGDPVMLNHELELERPLRHDSVSHPINAD